MKDASKKKSSVKRVKQTVILKWNPAVSSIHFYDFLSRILWDDDKADWSIWDYGKVRKGDRFFMLKVGCGTCGIVEAGTITSDPTPDKDWSGQGRKVYYCDYQSEIMINPETLPIIGTEQLQAAIPDFDWTGGHAGTVLNDSQAKVLQKLYVSYLRENAPLFADRFELINRREMENDQLYLSRSLSRKLFERS